MPVAHVTDDQFDAEVLQSKLPVIVDFYAEWCGPCKLSAPILEKLSEEFKDKVKIVKVDVDQSDKAGEFGVMSIPTIVPFKEGKEIEGARQIGFSGEQKYRDLIQSTIGK